MNMSIFKKIMLLSVSVVVLVVLSVVVPTLHFVSSGFERESSKMIAVRSKIIAHQINVLQEKFLEQIRQIADRQSFAAAVAAKDTEALKVMAPALMKSINGDFMTISDETGKVLGRGHSNKIGDSVMNQGTVQLALKGQGSTGIVSGTVVPFSIRSGCAVMHEGKLVGTVSTGISLVTDTFADGIKKHADVEFTVFKGDTRVATTLAGSGGTRAVGTKMDNPVVIKTVLEGGQTFFNKNIILGKEYQTCYWPIRDLGDKIVGMWFVGIPMQSFNETLDRVLFSSLICVGLALPIVFGISWRQARAVSRPLRTATNYASRVAGGDLSGELTVTSRDEVGVLAEALRGMVHALKEKIGEAENQAKRATEETAKARTALDEVAEARRQAALARRESVQQVAAKLQNVVESISSASDQLAAQIEKSLAAVTLQNERSAESAASMEQMHNMVHDVARSAGRAADLSTEAKSKAVEGARLVNAMVSGINEVNDHSDALTRAMDALGLRAEGIGRILSVISDIADQTNLLALNAAIEAARAGDAGRGFAVVADEVRKLAEKTMTATKEVGDAISGIQGNTRTNISQLSNTVKEMEAVALKAREAGRALDAIVSLSDTVSGQVAGIASASEEESAAAARMHRAANEISAISGEISGDMRQSAQAVANLTAQTHKLLEAIHDLNKGVQ